MAVDTIDALLSKIRATGKQYDLELIRSAYDLAEHYHHDQRRRSGEPYIIHPLETAAILVDYGMDTESICAALLHDTLRASLLALVRGSNSSSAAAAAAAGAEEEPADQGLEEDEKEEETEE